MRSSRTTPDAFAVRRGSSKTDDRVDERASTLIELNNRLDGLMRMPPKVLFLATTSRPELLDESFVRPGRFDLAIRLQPDGMCAVVDVKSPTTVSSPLYSSPLNSTP